MSTNEIQDLFQQATLLLHQLVGQLAEQNPTRTLASVSTAVLAAKECGSDAALLEEIFKKHFPGQQLPDVLGS